MDLQLRITTDIESLPAAIEFNYPELKAAMESYLEKFKGLVVTEDAIKRAKDDRAEINKVVAAISRARIDTKARWLAPMESFEAKAKELEELGKSTARGIDAQLAEFEKRRVDEKRKALTAQLANRLTEAFGDDMEEPERKTSHWREFFAAQTNPKTAGNWLNKSVSETKAATQMNAEIQRCKAALASLAEIYADEDAEVRTAAKFALCRRFDMADAAAEVKRFKEQRAAAERMKAEEERKRRDGRGSEGGGGAQEGGGDGTGQGRTRREAPRRRGAATRDRGGGGTGGADRWGRRARHSARTGRPAEAKGEILLVLPQGAGDVLGLHEDSRGDGGERRHIRGRGAQGDSRGGRRRVKFTESANMTAAVARPPRRSTKDCPK